MVRVMSVHHFASQDIHTCEDPLAVTTAPPDLLLLALPQHIVDVRDLSKGGDTAFMFPTVDEVQLLVHCCTGNYVATLESKQTRQGKESIYARIYANWDSSPHYDLTIQPMRARIAGRVTPSSAQSGTSGLEMIELPLKRLPNALACCQITGNLVLASQMTLTLYHFQVRTHDISRLKFIDFEESPVGLEISFVPWKLELCEDVIACMSKESLHVLKVCYGSEKWLTEQSKDISCECPDIISDDGPIDWDEITKNEKQRKTPKFVPSASNFKDSTSNKNGKPMPLVMYLPGIMSGKSSDTCSTAGGEAAFRHSPFIIAPPGMNVSSTSPATRDIPVFTLNDHGKPGKTKGWTEESRILHLLQLRIPSLSNTPGLQHMCVPNDQFHCLLLKPLYAKDPASDISAADKQKTDGHPMCSGFSKHLCGVLCLVTTHQEGYLYYFSMDAESSLLQQAACVTVYPFTAPVSCVVLEDCLLHALTDTGLETYTLRIGHYMPAFNPEETNVTPAWAEPVCLVGLRPFLGVEHLLLSNSYLLLLACSESSSNSSLDSQGSNWTLYSLQTPSPLTLYADIMSVGGMHRWTSPGTYGHLLGEAYLILKVSLSLLHWKPHQECAIPYQNLNKDQMEELYKESCALLGDYYITGSTDEDWVTAIPCYKLSGLSPIDVVERVKKIDIPEEIASATKQNLVNGLMKYLKASLLHMNWAENNANFTPAIPSFTNTLLDLFEEHDPDEVSWLTLRSSLLREYATDRILNIMKKQLCSRFIPKPSDAVTLVLLCIQKGSPGQAVAVLDSLPEEQLSDIILSNSSLLFEMSSGLPNTGLSTGHCVRTETALTFSELSVVLMDTKPMVLANILSTLVVLPNQTQVTLHDILKVFLEYIPSRIGITGSTASLVLQIFLEKYFSWYFTVPPSSPSSYDPPTVEALKILVRSYLSDLQRCDLPNSGRKFANDSLSIKQQNKSISALLKQQSILFIDKHLPFLQKMPPFAPSFSKKLMSMQSAKKNVESINNEDHSQNNESLIKLQSLLCSNHLPKECLVEVYQFVQSHPQLYGNLSLQVLCLPAREGATVLMNFCPQVLLLFAKNKFVAEVEWKYLLLLLQRKIYALPDDNVVKPLYVQVMKDCLSHLSATLPLEEFCKVLPPGTETSYQQFIRICQQVSHANHILSLIMATGQQLLSTLHL